MWWYTSVILVLRKLRQEDHVFHSSLGYIVRTYLKKSKLSKIKFKNKNSVFT
jgi:hypothetical protein